MTSDDVVAANTRVVRDLVELTRELVGLLKQHMEQDHGLKGATDGPGTPSETGDGKAV